MKKFVLIFLSFLFLQPIFSQLSVIDSLRQQLKIARLDTVKIYWLNDIAKFFQNNNPDSCIKYANLALNSATKINYEKGIAQAYTLLGLASTNLGDYEKATGYQIKSVTVRENLHDTAGIASSYVYLGVINSDQAKYPEATLYYFKALKLFEKINDKKGQGNTLNNLGNINYLQNAFPVALNYYVKALNIRQEINDRKGMAKSYNNVGLIYEQLKQYDKALDYYFKSLELKKALNEKKGIAYSYNNIGVVYENLKKYDEANKYYTNSLLMCQELGDKFGIAVAYNNLGKIYIKNKDYPKAIEALNNGLKVAQEIGTKEDIKSAYEGLCLAYKETKNFERALENHILFSAIKDTILNEKNSELVKELDVKYQTEKKEQENKLLSAQNKISEQSVKQHRTFSMFIITCLILAVGLAFFIFRGLKQQRRANKLISVQKQQVEHKNHIIEEKQKEILDSINYAKRIQYALLANSEYVKTYLPYNFIFFKPKDIVSGDFYWAAHTHNSDGEELFYLAVCDSTGHGVPGAFMSLLNIGFLSEAIKEKDIFEPNKVFDYVRKRLVESISSEQQKDGFDGILLCVNKVKRIITYSAANNKPIIVSNEMLVELPCDKMPVGRGDNESLFTLYDLKYRKGDMLYLFTDGYADQFGGPKGKKFKYKPLYELLRNNSSNELITQKNILEKQLVEWQGNLDQVDDVLVVGLRL